MIIWKINRVSCFAFAALLCNLVLAQTEGYEAQRNMNFLMSGGMWRSYDQRFKGIEGSPFLFSDFRPGSITLNSAQQYNLDSINLDIYNDELLVKRKGTDIIVLKKIVKEFKFPTLQDSLHFVKLKDKFGKESFYQLIHSNKYSLLKKPIKNISEPTNSGAYSNGRMHSEFVESEKFYLMGMDAIIELKSKGDLLSHFQEYRNELNLFIKKNDIGFKSQEKLTLLAAYISALTL